MVSRLAWRSLPGSVVTMTPATPYGMAEDDTACLDGWERRGSGVRVSVSSPFAYVRVLCVCMCVHVCCLECMRLAACGARNT
jgi:hypothetical protein